MAELISIDTMQEIMDWSYEKAVDGIGFGSAYELAQDYMNNDKPLVEQVNTLIRYQNTKAGTLGGLANMGGLITLPAALPANIASTLYIQVRMIAAIAHMGGYDIKSDQVQTMVYGCLLGNGATEVLKDVGVSVGTKFAYNFIQKKVSGEVLKKINKAVGFRLLTKAGSTGVINLTKVVPVLGGVIGGSFDAYTTNIVGNTARKIFIEDR